MLKKQSLVQMILFIFCYTFSQIWLQVREESRFFLESYYILAIFWNLLSNFGNLKKILKIW